ncbi:hypothetical protein DFP73DRAFT_636574 [Morchella snyderi]|nr:hypothetical protein DFP73DRAFT_636574 [Morchella snyderi]
MRGKISDGFEPPTLAYQLRYERLSDMEDHQNLTALRIRYQRLGNADVLDLGISICEGPAEELLKTGLLGTGGLPKTGELLNTGKPLKAGDFFKTGELMTIGELLKTGQVLKTRRILEIGKSLIAEEVFAVQRYLRSDIIYNIGLLSFALNAGRTATHCLEFLELIRGVILGNTIRSRTNGLSESSAEYPDMYEEHDRLRAEIDTPSPQRQEQNAESTIRKLPDYEKFQLPPSLEKLMGIRTANGGPIITINCSSYRSDDIRITGTGIMSLPLPLLKYKDVERRMKEFNEGIICGSRTSHPARNMKLKGFLLRP